MLLFDYSRHFFLIVLLKKTALLLAVTCCWFTLHSWTHFVLFVVLFYLLPVENCWVLSAGSDGCGTDSMLQHWDFGVCTSVYWPSRTHVSLDVTQTALWLSTLGWWRPRIVRQLDAATWLWSATLLLTYFTPSLARAHSICLIDDISVC